MISPQTSQRNCELSGVVTMMVSNSALAPSFGSLLYCASSLRGPYALLDSSHRRFPRLAKINKMNRIRFNITVLAAAILITGSQQSLAKQEQPTPSEHEWIKKYTEDKNRKNFADWVGILFYCHPPKNQEDDFLVKICERSYLNANFLAASAKIDLERAQDLKRVGFESVVGDRLILMIDFTATRKPTAVSVTLTAYTTYSGPVNTIHESGEGEQTRTNMRSGDLILWGKGLIASSSNNAQDLIGPLSEAIDGLLKEFFTDYLSARR